MIDLVLTLIGADRPGLVEAVAQTVADRGGNWLESRMIHLAGKFAGILRVEVPPGQADALARALEGLGATGLRVVAASSERAAPEIVAAWVMIGAEAVRQPEVRTVYQRMVADELALLATLLADCLRAAGRVAEAATPLAAGLAALIAGAYQLSSATTDVMPRGYAAEAATRYAELAVAAAPMRR